MLGMVDVELIKKLQTDGWSIREIARTTGWSRQTVRKALRGSGRATALRRGQPAALAGDGSLPRRRAPVARRRRERAAQAAPHRQARL